MDEEIRQKILALLDQHRIMTIATLRPDGWPQATTVGYAHEGLTLYFLCGPRQPKGQELGGRRARVDHHRPRRAAGDEDNGPFDVGARGRGSKTQPKRSV